MNETNNTPEPAHDCAEIIAGEMYAIEKANRTHPEIWRNWDDFPKDEKAARIVAVKALPRILVAHAGEEVKAWLTIQEATSSGWTKWLFGLAGAAVTAAACFFASCSPSLTPEQVQQWDAGHAAAHAATGTACTLSRPVTVTPSK